MAGTIGGLTYGVAKGVKLVSADRTGRCRAGQAVMSIRTVTVRLKDGQGVHAYNAALLAVGRLNPISLSDWHFYDARAYLHPAAEVAALNTTKHSQVV